MARLVLKNNFCQVLDENDEAILARLDMALAFRVKGIEFAPSVQKGTWDGFTRILTGDLRFPYGLKQRVIDFYSKWNKELIIEDQRGISPVRSSIDILPRLKEMGKSPYPHQLDVIDVVDKNDCGIIRSSTGSGKCIQETDICLTSEGMLMFKEIGQNLAKGEYRELNSVVASPLVKSGLEKTSHIYRDGYGISREYKTRSGFTSTATPAHQIKIIDDNGDMVWHTISDLKENDVAIICKNQQMFGDNETLTLDEAYFCGIITGDGTWTKKTSARNTVYLTNQDKHILSFFSKYANSKNLNGIINQNNKSLTCKSCRITNKNHSDWLKTIMSPALAYEKTIPNIIRKSKKEIVAMYIRGLYETDGWIEAVGNKPSICIGLSSKELIDQLHVILLNFGIVACRRVKKTTHKDSHILTIYRNSIYKFINEIGLDPNGHKFIKLNNVMNKMENVKINLNFDKIPNQSKKIKIIKNLLIEKLGLNNFKNILKEHKISEGTLRSWSDDKAWREPSRPSLFNFINFAKKYIQCEEINNLEFLCSEQFLFDRIVSIKETMSDNYDFVVPDTHSFVAQGFVNHNTLMSALMTAHFNKKTIIYVIGMDLLYQTQKLFSQIFDQPIGIIGDGHCDIQDITIASVWTLGVALNVAGKIILDDDIEVEKKLDKDHYKKIVDYLKSAKVHIVDECHLAACETLQEISRKINPEHVYGMSASPVRDDGADLLIESFLGKNIVDISASTLIKSGHLVKPIIRFLNVPPLDYKVKKHYQTIYKNYVVENDVRNNKIIKGAEALVSQGYQTLVLFNSIAHGQLLYNEISKKMPCGLLSGKDDNTQRNLIKKQLEDKEINCIIASRIFDIGVDLPSLSGLIIASGGKSTVRALQRIGRVIRKYPGKKQAAILDFADSAHYLDEHSEIRKDIYSMEPEFEVQWKK